MNPFLSTNLALSDRKLAPFLDDMAVAEPATSEPSSAAHWQHAAVCRENCAQLTLGIVHEMNNLTGGIAVLSEIYLGGAESGLPMTEGLELIHKSTGRLQTLVRQLKVIHGPISEEPTYFNVAECVRNSFELFALALPKDIAVTTDFPAEELAACLDEAAFRQLLLDLTLNLRDALATCADAERKLRLSLRRVSHVQVEMTITPAADFEDDLSQFSSLGSVQARWHDADRIARSLGVHLTRRPGGGYALQIPLIA